VKKGVKKRLNIGKNGKKRKGSIVKILLTSGNAPEYYC